MFKQEKTQNNQSIIKEAISNYPKAFSGMSIWLINFLLLIIISCALGFLSTYTFFITIPLILAPFFFAIQQVGNTLRLKGVFDNSTFKRYFKLYFTPAFFGSYRLLRSALFSLLIAIVGTAIFGGMYFGIGVANGLDFNTAFNNIYQAYVANDLSALNSALSAEPIVSYIAWTSVFESCLFAFSFWMHLMRYSTLTYLRSSMIGNDPKFILFYYRVSVRSKKAKGYNKDYILSMLPIIALALIGLGLGIFVGYKLTNIEVLATFFENSSYFYAPSFIALTGILFMAIIIVLLMPYYFDCIYLLMNKYFTKFQEGYIEATKDELQKAIKHLDKYPPEERKQIQQAIEQLQKFEEEKENKPVENDLNASPKTEEDKDKKEDPKD